MRFTLAIPAVLALAACSGAPAPTSKSKEEPSALYTSALPADLNCAVPGGKLPGDVKVHLVEVAGCFVDPIEVASPKDGTGRLFVCERPGRIRVIKNGKVLDEPFYDNMANTAFQFLECGLYAIEFHPKFKENGLFYVSYADMWFNGATMIVEYKVAAGDPNKADMASARPVMRIDFPYANHHGGKIAFGPDGYLYVSVGDGGWEGEHRPRGGHALAILPGLTHYNAFSSPLFAAAVLDFLDRQPMPDAAASM